MINADAGAHPVPSDPRVLDASLRAGDRCWRRFPYLSERYGERGHRFTRSDSAWLATLTRLDLSHMAQHVGWLRGVLATRGIPSNMLQTHLELLADELDLAMPADITAHTKLREAAGGLRDARQTHISDAQIAALSETFDGSAAASWRLRLPQTPLILAAAVVDEIDGSPGAVANLSGWLTDCNRFPADWIAAVKAVVSQAQAAAAASVNRLPA